MDEFREWLSDNLRYIALILGVLIVLGGAFLGVRAVTKSGSTPNTETATDSMDNSTGGLVTSGSAKPSGTAAGSLKDTAALVTEDGQLTEEAQNGIKTVVKSYYDALNARNVEAVKKVTDTLSAEDIASIESSKTAYSGVSVIPKVGPTTDGRSAVAFVDYKYQNPDQAILHSGLSWLYLQFNENEGAYKIKVDAADDAAVKTYAQSLTADPEIASVMQRVQVEADAAAAADQGVSQAAAEPAAESGETESAVTEGQPEADAAQSEGQAEVEATDGQAEADAAAQAEAVAAQAQADAAAAAAREQAEAAAQAQAQAEAVAAQTRESGDAAAQAQADAVADAAAAQAQAAADAATQAQAQAQAGARAGDTAVILETCNVRKGAGYDYEVVTVAEEGASVTIIDDEGQGWVHVRTENGDGYIGRKFIYGETN
ncbi:MAG: SH3 domain-containing protein [Mogibacterium sp.]|nr:SH3 domain-containing protein [Mogibacterium sp.]